jgi:hypothetical protein
MSLSRRIKIVRAVFDSERSDRTLKSVGSDEAAEQGHGSRGIFRREGADADGLSLLASTRSE